MYLSARPTKFHDGDFEKSSTRDHDPHVLRLICASEATRQDRPYAQLEAIRSKSMPFNEERQVSAALLYMAGWYLQWLEGREQDVLEVVERISFDKRHAKLRVLHHGFGPRLLADPWNMGMIQPNECHVDIGARVNQLRAHLIRGHQYSPVSVWRRVTMPMHASGRGNEALKSPPLRIMLTSALGHQSHAFVSWMAERFATSAVEHRYAGPNTPDLGLTYVDFVQGSNSCRLVAAARHCLSIGLSKIMHSDFSHWLCLFSGDVQRDDELIERVVKAFAGSRSKPRVIGIAAPDTEGQPIAQRLRASGFEYVQAAPTATGGNWGVLEVVKALVAEPRSGLSSQWPMA